MVAEAAVVGVLLHGHQLQGVVALAGDGGQHVAAEGGEVGHGFALRGHAHVSLVDAQPLAIREGRGRVPPGILGLRHPQPAGEVVAARVLRGVADPGGDAVFEPAAAGHPHLDRAGVYQPLAVGRVGEEGFPLAVVAAGQRVGLAIPLVEVAHQGQVLGLGRPLAVPQPRLTVGAHPTGKPKVLVPARHVGRQALGQLRKPFQPPADGVGVGGKVPVVLNKLRDRRGGLSHTAMVAQLPRARNRARPQIFRRRGTGRSHVRPKRWPRAHTFIDPSETTP